MNIITSWKEISSEGKNSFQADTKMHSHLQRTVYFFLGENYTTILFPYHLLMNINQT